MEASIVDLRRKMSEVIKALDRNESVTILYRGKKKGVLVPIKKRSNKEKPIKEHPAYGIWKNRDDMKNVGEYVRKLRKGRIDDL
ncbi:MAG: type II toxin-antitoxin system prevent-host-death family antitoxin [Candidatus Scalindua sp. AMX11]|nr:MAG: type II toxin-antitoxin system prevent-host-death family antitoxin [Candidatus Scalindua sp.]NOG82806.1 type II toxin-antitoxin system prevent-host-death family antitoxin [Planctomycetota bacterium]RZV69034.1 MAG: type II toxin-antitoxin system prevent-host-death family antitoxin [Candidatus Scalindua sp. SCAELEC01]TDE63865.1 MAG: type II toxin-antitoxin system prevent-host-death family antitoxin [Candidatus Scalindua sp. AMX11]GJQ60421.1 MAG: hypothetical protein SCALA701_32220 [Candid